VTAILQVEGLVASHGLLQAVREVSFEVERGEVLALVGANGAGKTTLLRAIAGAHAPSAGRVLLDGEDVTRVRAYARVARGIALVPEGRRLFPQLTVEENLRVAKGPAGRGSFDLERAFSAFPLLGPLRRKRAATLSGGEQQATAIARALVTNPRVLLLDEVSLGLAPQAVESVYQALHALIAEQDLAIVLVEQDLGRALAVSQQLICLLEGRIVLRGRAGELDREEVTNAYFGLRRPPLEAAPT
jgi:branched-chain amino acid transport system ATP-binding protein